MIGAITPDPRPALSLPSVLHYLQREWSRFEHERARWAQERAELQARIGFLEGQHKAEEGLKRDLLRRIKMLEFALKQERLKALPAELRENVKPPFEKESATRPQESKVLVREGREILTQYLAEMGYTDAVIHAQAQRMKAMLDSWPPIGAAEIPGVVARSDYNVDSNNQSSLVEEKALVPDQQQPLHTIDIVAPEAESLSALDDVLLSMESEPAPPPPPAEASAVVEEELSTEDLERNFGQRFGAAGVKILSRAKKSADAANTGEKAGGSGGSSSDLGELADFSIVPESAPRTESSAGSAAAKKWTGKYNLRSHFDSVRALAWVGSDLTLLSASEDKTVKLWHLPQAGKKANFDVEASWTYRGHDGPVFAVAASEPLGLCFSAGVDCVIRSWRLVPADVDKFSAYTSYNAAPLVGHTDAVWALSAHPSAPLLVSASADGTCRLWNVNSATVQHTLVSSAGPAATPSCVEFLRGDFSKLLVGFSDGAAEIFDVQTGVSVRRLRAEEGEAGAVLALTSHPTLPLAVTAHRDKHLRYYDTQTGAMLFATVAHQDVVTAVDVDPTGLHFVSAGHDRSIRLWDVALRRCVSEFTSHRKKFDEAIHAVRFHSSLPYLASGGADSIVRVYA